MFFRPSFCANCGERVERTEWYPWTSRRFCIVCESEYKGQDLIPRFAVGAGIVLAIFGVGSYIKSGTRETSTALVSRRQAEPAAMPSPVQQPPSSPATQSAPVGLAAVPVMNAAPQPPPHRQAAVPTAEVTQSTYFCGAETKKGTPCSRRVKGNVRCYQHQGMPAMVSPGELRLK